MALDETGSSARCSRPRAKRRCLLPERFEPVGIPIERLLETVREYRALSLHESNPERTEFGGNGWRVRAYRPAGARLLVIEGRCVDCTD